MKGIRDRLHRLAGRGHLHRSARNIEIRSLLDTFFVCSIATILIIRLQLWATNYPKLGGGKLHIAHLLWGGLMMLIALIILVSFISRSRRHFAAFLGGVGFGFFIDEIGKFVTSDNDYFFKPAAGIIYIVFLVLFLVLREIGWRREFTAQECLANVMSLLAESTYRPLSQQEHRLARTLLSRCDADDKLVVPLTGMLDRIEEAPARAPGRLARARDRIRAAYLRLAANPRFGAALVVVFALIAVATLVQVGLDAHRIINGTQKVRVITVAGMASSVVVAAMVLLGIRADRESRFDAYRWFDRALLVQVFVTEVFAFLEDQFGAVFELLFFMFLLLTLRIMIHTEVRAAAIDQAPAPSRTVQAGDSVVTA
jgi:hypothetical protein